MERARYVPDSAVKQEDSRSLTSTPMGPLTWLTAGQCDTGDDLLSNRSRTQIRLAALTTSQLPHYSIRFVTGPSVDIGGRLSEPLRLISIDPSVRGSNTTNRNRPVGSGVKCGRGMLTKNSPCILTR